MRDVMDRESCCLRSWFSSCSCLRLSSGEVRAMLPIIRLLSRCRASLSSDSSCVFFLHNCFIFPNCFAFENMLNNHAKIKMLYLIFCTIKLILKKDICVHLCHTGNENKNCQYNGTGYFIIYFFKMTIIRYPCCGSR
jgi:hypothetical protein